jgi:hypothetical protein
MLALLADGVMILHLIYVLFAALGGLLTAWRARIVWLHAPALLWAILIQYTADACPLTALENGLRRAAGGVSQPRYIERLLAALFPPVRPPHEMEVLLAVSVILLNLALYGRLCQRLWKARSAGPTWLGTASPR